ncbi:hypothetical protein EPUS_07590 [Endocarpon pusillum Z07020]|uniref:Chitin synthase n=1 Tax=Endocarpon pusillum (strain Z07020 / HMAS-L-300199) TaxID=1263415 RepID=U1HLA5_ENDPU|nr:uncharacterized protein EPUS_07590 [Endocarpon pusillum Z07020]ERF69764.1 hypothetical protein EPUS_07590 [Endocarpon pusillum Z07020]
MNRIPDLVRDSQLDTRFHPKYTTHVYYESGPTPRKRVLVREEYWKREKYIGGGSFGSVWLEKCVKGQREVEVRAVKEIPKPQQPSRPVNYNRELEAMAKFSHWKYERCFVKSFGWYEGADALFIAMEYFQHGDLQKYLSSTPPLSESESQQISLQILEGLSFLHGNGFAHRDLKPGNILIKSTPPEQWWVKIGDFGISKRAEDGVAVSSTLKGTLGFMAPELHGFAEVGSNPTSYNAQRADIWSVGEIAFRMLTKEPTFRNMAALFTYVHKPQTFPSALLDAHNVSPLGTEFIKSTMMPAPEMRPTAQEALLHKWIEFYRSLGERPASIASTRSSLYQEPYSAVVSDSLTEPSGRWSTVPISELRPPPTHSTSAEEQSGLKEHILESETPTGSTMKVTTANRISPLSPTAGFQQSPELEGIGHREYQISASPVASDGQSQNGNLWSGLPTARTEMVQNEEPFIRPRRPDAAASLSSTTDLPYRPQATNQAPYSGKYETLATNQVPYSGKYETLATNQVPYSGKYEPLATNWAPYPDKYDESGLFGDIWPVTHQQSFHQHKDSLSPFEHDEFEANAIQSAEGPQSADQWVQQSRQVRPIELFRGNLVVDHPVPEAILKQVPHAEPPMRDEFTHFRYTAVVCDPSNFTNEHYQLRPSLFAKPRHTELLIIVPCAGADRMAFAKTVQTIILELIRLSSRDDFRRLCSDNRSWKSIVLCFLGDKDYMDPSILDVLGNLGLPTTPWDFVVDVCEAADKDRTRISHHRYDDGVCYPRQIKGRKTTARIYEYTTQFTVVTDEMESITVKPGETPIQTILCLQEASRPIDNNPWIRAIGGSLRARLCIIVETGTKVKENSIYRTWESQATWWDGNMAADGQYLKIVYNKESSVKTWLAQFGENINRKSMQSLEYVRTLPREERKVVLKCLQAATESVFALATIVILVGFMALPSLPVIVAADECSQDENRGPDEEVDQ